jgi:hypothetical protein
MVPRNRSGFIPLPHSDAAAADGSSDEAATAIESRVYNVDRR